MSNLLLLLLAEACVVDADDHCQVLSLKTSRFLQTGRFWDIERVCASLIMTKYINCDAFHEKLKQSRRNRETTILCQHWNNPAEQNVGRESEKFVDVSKVFGRF